MIEKIYIVRHGFRLNWVTTNWTSVTGLPRDPPLAAFGITQAGELGVYLSTLPEAERPTAIFSSPYYRCLQTAQPAATALGLPIYVEHGLSEWFSPAAPGTGFHPRPESATSLQQYFLQIDPAWSSIWYPSRKGEDVDKVHDRLENFMVSFAPELERRFPGKHTRVLFVSHAATIIALTRILLGDRSFPLRIGCCSLSELVKGPSMPIVGHWKVLRLGDGSHMKDGTAREWGFEDIEIANGKIIDDVGIPGTENEEEGISGSALALTSNL